LEHLESEGFQEDWFYYYKERHWWCSQLCSWYCGEDP
jgi:hypothetical protein